MPETAHVSEAQPSPSGSNRPSPGDSASGRSGGDTVVGRAVVDRGWATRDEVDKCREIQSRLPPGTRLTEVLVQKEVVTRRQLARLQKELESDRGQAAIPGYQMMRKLGAGAMATVYLAKQLSLDRLVAIKILPKKFSSDPKFIERFYKEGRAAAKLNDQHIVGALDVGQAGEHHYFVMEFVDGDTVHERIQAAKRMPESEALALIRQVALALRHAHEKGFIHRDIKPKNIMISKAGVAKLADLGLARAVSDREAAEAEAGKAFGTPYYISPEQARGAANITPAADIYGLGATFYHMLTGRVPFEGKNPTEVMQRHLKDALTPPDHLVPELSQGTAMIVEMMMAKDARDRYQNASQLLEDLDAVIAGQPPVHARPGETFVTQFEGTAQQAGAEADAPIPVLPGSSRGMSWLSLALGALLLASALVNMWLLMR
jgi:serine/threonine protein kinase